MSIDTDFDNLLGDLSSAIADLESISAVSKGGQEGGGGRVGGVCFVLLHHCAYSSRIYTMLYFVFLSLTAN